MSTVVIDEKYRDRLIANEINKSVRHCKIGKVKPKAKWVLKPWWLSDPIKPSPMPFYHGGYAT